MIQLSRERIVMAFTGLSTTELPGEKLEPKTIMIRYRMRLSMLYLTRHRILFLRVPAETGYTGLPTTEKHGSILPMVCLIFSLTIMNAIMR